MTLGDVVHGLNKSTDIESRMVLDINGTTEDMLFGLCHWDNDEQELVSLDGDDYSLGTEIIAFRAERGRPLVVWEQAEVFSL